MPSISFLKDNFQSQIAPGDDAEFLRLITEADMRLLEMGRWRWTRTRATLTETDGIITLDSEHASILGLQVNDYPPPDIFGEEYEFVPDGVGDIEVGIGNIRLVDQGLNNSGQRTYKLTGGLPTTTTLTGLVLYAPATLYDPDIPDSALPADATNITRCPSAPALKQACLGIIFEEAHDLEAANRYMNLAQQTLDNLEQNQRGTARQIMDMKPTGRGVRGIRNFR